VQVGVAVRDWVELVPTVKLAGETVTPERVTLVLGVPVLQ
jgi:hypothetical protein